MNATPVPESGPRLPKTIEQTLTAVPRSCGMRSAAVELGAVGVPGVEDRVDGEVHLLARLLREVPPGLGLDDLLELRDQLLQVRRFEVRVDGDLLGLLRRLQRVLEELAVDAEDRLAEHLDETAVRVPREAVVTGLLGEALHRLVGEPDVQDGVHHARHGELRPGTDGYEQGVIGLPELLAHPQLQRVEVCTHLVTQCRRLLAAVEVGLARLGGDREARRDGKTQVGHLGEVRTLAAEEVLEVFVALGEVINELHSLNRALSYVGIFVFRHESRLLDVAVAALTTGNIPRSKASGYVHLRVMRL